MTQNTLLHMKALTDDNKRSLVKRFLSEEQYRYADAIVNFIEKIPNGFTQNYYEAVVSISLAELQSDPLVSPVDALSDLLAKYKGMGYYDISSIEYNEFRLTGTFQETIEQFEARIKHSVNCWLSANVKTEAEIRTEIQLHESAIQQLKELLTD